MKKSNENRIIYEHDLLTRLIHKQELANRSQTEDLALDTMEREAAMEDCPINIMHSPTTSIRKFGPNVEYRPSVTARSKFNIDKESETSYRLFHEEPERNAQGNLPSIK